MIAGGLAEREFSVDRVVDRLGAALPPVKLQAGAPAPRASSQPAQGGENQLDRMVHATVADMAGGFSPMALMLAGLDWAAHLAVSPGRQAELWVSAAAKQAALMRAFGASLREDASAGPGRPDDRRFRAQAWAHAPFSLYADAFLAAERWWDEATSKVHGANPHHLALVNFVGRQALDMAAPSNFLLTNPVALDETWREGGANLARGAVSFAEDYRRALRGERSPAERAFTPGERVAVTKGVVVKRTGLAEIIQYAPASPTVHPEPVVIVPAWIMKYYILDLSPENSLIRHLVEQGFTVFCVSWRNPTAADRDIGFDDYRREGVMAALNAALTVTGAAKAHLVGYCIGGTLASITAAGMARDNDDRLQSLTLFASQSDFEEAGELRLFIDDSQLALLEDEMWTHGALQSRQMAGAFDLLRSNDLIWSRMIHHYLMGEAEAVEDLSAWSSDATRMPYRMHSEYLRDLYLNNDLAEGRFRVDGRPVALQDIHAPMFVVGTERDHVAPWRSVFKIHHLADDAEITFALVSGGHNRGVVAPPGPGRRYRIATTGALDPRPDPDGWMASASAHEDSWWFAWFDWLARHSGSGVAPPPLGAPEAGLAPLGPAPGEYVKG
jgi:polyhydroxyalkanoate synthase subunit PhaC